MFTVQTQKRQMKISQYYQVDGVIKIITKHFTVSLRMISTDIDLKERVHGCKITITITW